MPTRYLKPGIRDSERMEALSELPDAECLFYRLLVTVDDFGRFDARPLVIKANCFPLRLRANADNCMQWLKSLESVGLIQLYVVDNKEYLQIARWDNKPRAEKSKFPDPPTDVYNCPQMLPVTVTDVPELELKPEPKLKPLKTTPNTKKNGHAFELPDWIPTEHWNAWIEARTKARKPITDYAKRLAVRKLDNFRDRGHPPAQVLMRSAMNGWADLFEPKE